MCALDVCIQTDVRADLVFYSVCLKLFGRFGAELLVDVRRGSQAEDVVCDHLMVTAQRSALVVSLHLSASPVHFHTLSLSNFWFRAEAGVGATFSVLTVGLNPSAAYLLFETPVVRSCSNHKPSPSPLGAC